MMPTSLIREKPVEPAVRIAPPPQSRPLDRDPRGVRAVHVPGALRARPRERLTPPRVDAG